MAAGESTQKSSGGFISGLAPWIVYWILVGNVDFRLAVLIAFGVALFELVHLYVQGKLVTSLDIGSAIAFAVLTLITFVGDEKFLERWIQPLTSGALLAIALGSILVGRPFAREYARAEVPEQYWNSPRFLRTTSIITWVWTAAFGIMTVSALIPPIVDGDNTFKDQDDTFSIVFYWVIPILALVAAIYFTKWYPDYVERREGVRPAARDAAA
jgi:hypothetical protein